MRERSSCKKKNHFRIHRLCIAIWKTKDISNAAKLS